MDQNNDHLVKKTARRNIFDLLWNSRPIWLCWYIIIPSSLPLSSKSEKMLPQEMSEDYRLEEEK